MKITNLALQTNTHKRFTEQWVSGRFFDFITAVIRRSENHFWHITTISPRGKKKNKNPKKKSKACPARNSLFFANSSQETGTSSSLIFRFSKYQIDGCFQIPASITQSGYLELLHGMKLLGAKICRNRVQEDQNHLVVMAQVDNSIS
jgi:hypothetical protein